MSRSLYNDQFSGITHPRDMHCRLKDTGLLETNGLDKQLLLLQDRRGEVVMLLLSGD